MAVQVDGMGEGGVVADRQDHAFTLLEGEHGMAVFAVLHGRMDDPVERPDHAVLACQFAAGQFLALVHRRLQPAHGATFHDQFQARRRVQVRFGNRVVGPGLGRSARRGRGCRGGAIGQIGQAVADALG